LQAHYLSRQKSLEEEKAKVQKQMQFMDFKYYYDQQEILEYKEVQKGLRKQISDQKKLTKNVEDQLEQVLSDKTLEIRRLRNEIEGLR